MPGRFHYELHSPNIHIPSFQVWRAFNQCPFDKVKVVVIGQVGGRRSVAHVSSVAR